MECTKVQVLRYILNKQGLIDRQKYTSRNVSRLGVFHSTLQTTPYLSLLARTHPFDPHHLRKLSTKSSQQLPLARLRCMRGTLHLVPQDIAPVVRTLFLHARRDSVLKRYQVPPELARSALEEICKVLKRHGPQTTVVVKKLLKEKALKRFEEEGHGDLLRWVRPVLQWGVVCGRVDYGQSGSASWRKADQKFSHREDDPEEPSEEEEDSHVKLLEWYIKTYGPATLEDFEWWCGGSACGWNKTKIRNAFGKIEDELELVTVKGCLGKKFYIHRTCKGDLEKEHKTGPIKMARFLPYEDALLKAYKATRNRFYCEENFEKFVEKSGEAKPTVWLNGTVIGHWEWQNKPNCDMIVHLREKTDEIVEELQEEAERVKEFIQAKDIHYKQIPSGKSTTTAKKRKSAPAPKDSTSSSSSYSSSSSSSSSSEEEPKKKKRKTF